MRSILKTTLAAVFATACISGASLAFAANNGNGNNNGGQHLGNQSRNLTKHDTDAMPTDPNTTGSIKCDNNLPNTQAGCSDTNGTNYTGQQQ